MISFQICIQEVFKESQIEVDTHHIAPMEDPLPTRAVNYPIHISCDFFCNPVDHFVENIFQKCRWHENNFFFSTLLEEKPVACSVNRKDFRDRNRQEKGKNFKHFPLLD